MDYPRAVIPRKLKTATAEALLIPGPLHIFCRSPHLETRSNFQCLSTDSGRGFPCTCTCLLCHWSFSFRRYCYCSHGNVSRLCPRAATMPRTLMSRTHTHWQLPHTQNGQTHDPTINNERPRIALKAKPYFKADRMPAGCSDLAIKTGP